MRRSHIHAHFVSPGDACMGHIDISRMLGTNPQRKGSSLVVRHYGKYSTPHALKDTIGSIVRNGSNSQWSLPLPYQRWYGSGKDHWPQEPFLTTRLVEDRRDWSRFRKPPRGSNHLSPSVPQRRQGASAKRPNAGLPVLGQRNHLRTPPQAIRFSQETGTEKRYVFWNGNQILIPCKPKALEGDRILMPCKPKALEGNRILMPCKPKALEGSLPS
eukprot:365066-Chlamydomonas_euryale.AAC.8